MVRFRRILCPVDFSVSSERAAMSAARLAAAYGASLKLLHVVSPVVPTGYTLSIDTTRLMETVERASQRRLNGLIQKLPPSGVKVLSELRVGNVVDEVNRLIETYSPDLIVMGTHGQRGFTRWIIGSTTERVLRHSPVPVLTIPASGTKRSVPKASFRRILVTTDFSKGSSNAMKFAESIAQIDQGRVTLMHVLEEMRALTSVQYRKQLSRKTQDDLDKLVPHDATVRWHTSIGVGTAYDAILRLLNKEPYDLVIMNTQGKGMLDRALLGSTSERVLRGAACAVMLIPPNRKLRAARPQVRRPRRT
jgi:nucleotide-binding universal stress UspA family protein